MAWLCKYRAEFTDILGLEWKIEIEEDSYGGAVIPMQCSGNPLTIEFMANSDDLFDSTIKGSRADLVVESANFQWIDLYTVQDMQFRMSIYHSSTTLYWRGYIMPGNYSEPYNTPSFSVTISASDGLGYLKNYLYKYKTAIEDDTYYTGRRFESQVILDILGKIGITGFKEFVNIYEESMNDTVDDSPIDQVKIDVDAFRDMYCYDVLEQILKKYNAVIRQIGGEYIIYRPVELAGATVYGRKFTSATAKTSVTMTPEQLISRTGNINDLRDVNGGTLMIQSPAKKVTINQDYGNKESWIKNWKFEGNKFSGGGAAIWVAGDWVNNGCSVGDVWPIGVDVPSEADGIVLANSNHYMTLDHYISQSFGDYAIIGAEVMCFEFEYQWFNRSGAARASQEFYFSIRDDAATIHLHNTDDSYAQWVAGAGTLYISEDVPDGPSGWQSWQRLIPGGIDAVGPYTIKFFHPDDTYFIGIGIRNVRFYSTADIITKNKRKPRPVFLKLYNWVMGTKFSHYITKYIDNPEIVEYKWVKTNAINGIEMESNMILGDTPKTGDAGTGIDNIIEQFAGGLASCITTLHIRSDTVTLDTGTGGQAIITCNGLTRNAVFNASYAQTVIDFVDSFAAAYAAIDVTIMDMGDAIVFTSDIAGVPMTTTCIPDPAHPDLDGSVVSTPPGVEATYATDYTTDWNTRGGSESKELLSIIADELADQYSRPKHFLTLPIMESNEDSATPHVDIMGNFQDSLNQVGGNNRIFAFNKGVFNTRDREWSLDLIEII